MVLDLGTELSTKSCKDGLLPLPDSRFGRVEVTHEHARAREDTSELSDSGSRLSEEFSTASIPDLNANQHA